LNLPRRIKSSNLQFHRSLLTVHRPLFTVHRPPFTIHRPLFTVHRPPFTIHRPLFTIHYSLFTNDEGRLPDKIMMTFHPQRWTDNHVLWLKVLILQRLKNVVKRGLVRL
jgi:hypothetical protein